MSPLRAKDLPPEIARRLGLKVSKPHKYGAKPTAIGNVKFDSQREADRAGELIYMLKAKQIEQLEIHPSYEIRVNGKFIGLYEADFRYRDVLTGATVVEDAKGVRTPVYRLKKKLVEAIHGIAIQEV